MVKHAQGPCTFQINLLDIYISAKFASCKKFLISEYMSDYGTECTSTCIY